MSHFPIYRPRRLRRTENLRRIVRETAIAVDDFVYPLFVVHGQGRCGHAPSTGLACLARSR
jgi:porphobilinogen synthase